MVFIDGCFWHGCPVHGVPPKTNSSYWDPKLARTRERDIEATAALERHGWTVLRFWEPQSDNSVAQETIEMWSRWSR